MNILHVIVAFSREWGGPVNSCYAISKMLSERGHKVTIITSDYKFDNLYANSLKNVEVIPFKTLIRYGLFIVTPGMSSWLKKNISKYDVIHLHEFQSYQNNISFYYASKYDIPYIMQARGLAPHIMKRSILKRIYNLVWGYKILRNTSKCLALTSIEKNEYMEMGCQENRIEILPNGIDLSQFRDIPQKGVFKAKYNIDLGDPLILFLGRIHVIKGIDILVKAFSKILMIGKYKRAKLVIVGPDEGQGQILRELIDNLDIEKNVIFTGPLYGEKKWEVFVDADIYALPSIYDAFPNTVLEAWAFMKPVLVTKGCCISNIVGFGGIVADYESVSICSAILYLLENEDERNRLGMMGRKLVLDEFQYLRIINKLEALYNECITKE